MRIGWYMSLGAAFESPVGNSAGVRKAAQTIPLLYGIWHIPYTAMTTTAPSSMRRRWYMLGALGYPLGCRSSLAAVAYMLEGGL
jgi:hypothetical protein